MSDLEFGRRSKKVGDPMLVCLPEGADWQDSGEGGLAFFLLVPIRKRGVSRQICCAGGISWPQQDVSFPELFASPQDLDAGLLIGSTGQSLFSKSLDDYFIPTLDDLTTEGKQLYALLKQLYGEVHIVTLLDT